MSPVSQRVDPEGIAGPAANYAHATLTTDARRWLHTSGVVPVAPDGSVPESVAAQAEIVWSNIEALLRDAEMGFDDVVAVTTYAVPGQDLAPIMAARDRRFGSHLAASTLVIVAELVRPEWKLEVSVIAAAT
jgi:2-iminobutanoate/2-iminopropanoate deaminase